MIRLDDVRNWMTSRIPNWSALSVFGQSSVAKSAYFWMAIVPLTVKLCEKVENIVSIDVLQHKWHLTMQLPFTWSILFWSSLVACIANILFSCFCPKIISQYKDFSSFEQESGSMQRLMQSLKIALRSFRKDTSRIKDASFLFQRYFRLKPPDFDLTGAIQRNDSEVLKDPSASVEQMLKIVPDNAYDNIKRDAFQEIRQFSEDLFPIVRFLTATLYAISTLMVSWIALQNACYVLYFSTIK